jgi:predicted GNAT family acetyltransferase
MSEVADNRDRRRYELAVDGHRAIAAYDLDGETITFTHTVVPPELEGQGIGSHLIKAALEDVRQRRLSVVAQCPFVAAYIDKHPEFADLLA